MKRTPTKELQKGALPRVPVPDITTDEILRADSGSTRQERASKADAVEWLHTALTRGERKSSVHRRNASTSLMILKFGKFKGVHIADTPSWYLSWLLKQDWPDAELIHAIELELHRQETRHDTDGSRAPRLDVILEISTPEAGHWHLNIIPMSVVMDTACSSSMRQRIS